MSLPRPSYPPDRYEGTGEVTAFFRGADSEPDYATGTTTYRYLATTTSTNGEYGLYRVDLAARAGGPATHFHKAMSESFFVLSGTLRLYDGEAWREGGPGDFLYVPPGGLHAFGNESDEPVSMLMLFAPGAPREGYFEGLAGLAAMDETQRAQFFVDHDSYFT